MDKDVLVLVFQRCLCAKTIICDEVFCEAGFQIPANVATCSVALCSVARASWGRAANVAFDCASPKMQRRPTCPRESMEKTVASLRTHSLAHSLNRLHASRPSVPTSSVARREVTRRHAAL